MRRSSIILSQKPDFTISIDPETRFIYSPSGSPSSIIQKNNTLRELGLNVVYMTFPHPITAKEYAGMIRSPIALGAAVTGQGLKTDIIAELDELDPLAKELQSVNTVVHVEGKLVGYNTDAIGFETAITERIANKNLTIKSAVVYGNGGVSGVAVKVLQKLGIEVTMAGRSKERVAKKMSALDLTPFEGPYDLVVSATPASSRALVEAKGLLPLLKTTQLVFDHNMPEKDGGKNSIKEFCAQQRIEFIPGGEMYVPQLVNQWDIFLGGLKKETGELWVNRDQLLDRVVLDSK
ncbi:MAG: hypothetical protein OCC49_01430 [Fibrobacterales bacterium]